MGITGVCNLNETYFKKKTKYIDLATKIKYRMGLKVAAVVMGATGIYKKISWTRIRAHRCGYKNIQTPIRRGKA